MLPLAVTLHAEVVGRITKLCPAAAPGGDITVVVAVSPMTLPCGNVKLPSLPSITSYSPFVNLSLLQPPLPPNTLSPSLLTMSPPDGSFSLVVPLSCSNIKVLLPSPVLISILTPFVSTHR